MHKNVNIYYSPILNVCINTLMYNSRFKNFKILFDNRFIFHDCNEKSNKET